MTRDAAAESARIAELQRLTYGRASTPAEAAQAEVAAQELRQLLAARTAAEHPEPAVDDADRDGTDGTTDVAITPRPWWQRPPALVGVLAAAIIGAGAPIGLLSPPGPPAAFAVFARAPDAAELALAGRLQQLGAPVDGLRIIGRAGAGELIAFRAPAGTAQQLADATREGEPFLPLTDESRFGENGEPVRTTAEEDVCLMVIDRGVPSGTACTTLDGFRERGLEVASRDTLPRGTWLADGSAQFEPLP